MTQTNLDPVTQAPSGSAAPAARGFGAGPARSGRAGARTLARLSASPLLGGLLLVVMAGCTGLIVLDAAAAKSPLIPPQPRIAGYLDGLGSMLDYRTFLFALLAMSAAYAGVIWCSRALSARAAIIAIVGLHLIVFAGPVLLSQDVFQYIDYGRLGVLHGLNPYQHGPAAAGHDAVFRYVGKVWYFTPAAYGPLFTLMSYPLALLGVDGAIWSMKLLALLASLATVAFVWLCARRVGRNPIPAALLVGVNPLVIVYGFGGFHNDLLMNALMMAGVWFALRGEDARAGAAVVAGAAVKATSIALLPFMLVARRRLTIVVGALIGAAVVAVASYLAFGVHGLDFLAVLRRNTAFVSNDSFPNEIAHMLGYPGVFPVDRTLYRLASVLALVWLLWRTWRGYDWISAGAWAMLILAVTTTWLLAWYLLWSLPLAVLARDRRVLWATLAVGFLFIAHQTAPLFSPT
jgi:alpha-1,6-mannosyltransferase